MELDNVPTLSSHETLLKDTIHEFLLDAEECNVIRSDRHVVWDEDVGDIMVVGSCLEVPMPLLPAAVILKLVLIRGTLFDAAHKQVNLAILSRSWGC